MTTPPDPLDLKAAGQLQATEGPLAEPLGTEFDVPGARKSRSRGQFQDIWRRYRRNRLALIGLVLVVILVVLAIAAPYITPYDPYDQNLYNTLQRPDSEHWFGTDTRGRDLFTLILYGLRLALLVGLATVAGSLLVGLTLGAIAGYRRGASDTLIMRTTDIFLAFPFLIGAILVVRAVGEGVWPVIVALVVLGWPTTARLMRGQVLALRESEYVEAARSIGASDTRIVLRHIFPNAIAPVLIYAFTSIGVAVIAMASLAYLGVGVPADEPEWGRLINQGVEQVQVEGMSYLWMFPAMAISLTTLAFAFVADGLRDALDPKLR
jgi:peptide/nickel transport system permease protein